MSSLKKQKEQNKIGTLTVQRTPSYFLVCDTPKINSMRGRVQNSNYQKIIIHNDQECKVVEATIM